MRRALGVLGVWIALTASVGHPLSAQDARGDGVRPLLTRLERAAVAGDAAAAYLTLIADSADRQRAGDFAATEFVRGITRVVVQERERTALAGTLPGNGYQLLLDVFQEFGARGRIATWRLDIKRLGEAGSDTEWLIADQERVSSVENLYRLSLNPTKQFTVRDLQIVQDDLELTLAEGSVFLSEIDQGTTGVVFVGRGSMRFHPAQETERTQIRIFSGADALDVPFDTLFLRLNPLDLPEVVNTARFTAVAVDARELRRADRLFRDESPRSYGLELGDLSREIWSILPGRNDLLAEIHSRRFNTLTYTRSASEPEDIRLYQRGVRKTIALYTSNRKRAANPVIDADRSDIDVLHYDIDAALSPDRVWFEGRARLSLRVRANAVNSLSLRLADSLVVQSVTSAEYGRLFAMRLKNQGAVVVSLPASILRDTELSVTVTYAGRLEPQATDAEMLAVAQRGVDDPLDVPPIISPEKSFLYSNEVDWYPKPGVSDFATAAIRLTVPSNFDCVASGELDPNSPTLVPPLDGGPPNKTYVFNAVQPVRYLAFVVSRFVRAQNVAIGFSPSSTQLRERPDGVSYRELTLSVEANPRMVGRGRQIGERAVDMALFYQALLDDTPYPSFTIAVVESERPGGHSPAYFAALNEPLPTAPFTWRNDPASFENYPDFFLAHELAHQWWGQAIGWRSYHDQWLSEGFAQYFAALYARRQRGDEVFAGVMRQMRRWATSQSSEGPISLGYRLGHLRGDSRIYRALVYNKTAVVLHMLRAMLGDDAFFRGVRRFYSASRFKNATGADFRTAMEQAAGRPLGRFFDRWIDGSSLPRLKFSYQTDGQAVDLHVEQVGDLFEMPVYVTLRYADRPSANVLIKVTDRTADLRVPLAGTLRSAEINTNDGALAEVIKN